MDTLGSRLREERKRQNLTLDTLGDAAGVSKQAMSKIETDSTQDPGARTLEAACRKLGLSIRWVIEGRLPRYAKDLDAALSQPARPDPDIIEKTNTMLYRVFAGEGAEFDLKGNGELFATAYAFIAERPANSEDSNLLDFSRMLRKRQEQARNADERRREAARRSGVNDQEPDSGST